MQIKEINNKQYVFCAWRKKYVRMTPEEQVRQRFLHILVEQYHYPETLIAVEVQLSTGRRADAVVYTHDLKPLVLIEFKAETVTLTAKVLDQIACYNRQVQVPYLMLCNGTGVIIARVDDKHIDFLQEIPRWEEMSDRCAVRSQTAAL